MKGPVFDRTYALLVKCHASGSVAESLRRSEFVALNVKDLVGRDEGITLTIASSKTDQEGQGQRIAIPRVEGSDY